MPSPEGLRLHDEDITIFMSADDGRIFRGHAAIEISPSFAAAARHGRLRARSRRASAQHAGLPLPSTIDTRFASPF